MALSEVQNGEVATRSRAPRWNTSRLIQWAIIVFTVVLVVLPLAPVLYQGLLDRALYEPGAILSFDNFIELANDPEFRAAAWNSILFALGSTAVSLLLGVSAAVLVGRTNIRFKWLLGALITWPLFISDLVNATGWSIMYGPAGYITQLISGFGLPTWNLASIPGMAVVGGTALAPMAFLYCLSAVQSIDPALESAARVTGAKPWKVLFSVVVPLLRPAILTSAFFNLILSLEMLSTPLIFGKPSGIYLFTTFIYMHSVQAVTQDYGQVGASATMLLVLLLIMQYAQRRMLGDTRRFTTIGGKASRQMEFELGALRWPLTIFASLIMIALVAVPLAGIILQAFSEFFSTLIPYYEVMTLNNFVEIFTQPLYLRALKNSLIIATFGAAAATVLVFLIATVTTRSKHWFGPALEFFTMLPRAIPGMIAGLGLFYASVLFPPLGWTRGTLLVLAIAFIMRYLPLGYGALMPNMVQVGEELDRSARVAGASWIRTMFSVVMPILMPAMIAAYAVFFLRFFKDYSTALFLYTPGNEVLGTSMLQLIWDGKSGPVSALALVQIAITGAFMLLVRYFGRVKLHG